MVTFLTTLKTSKEWTRCIDSYDNLLIKNIKLIKLWKNHIEFKYTISDI